MPLNHFGAVGLGTRKYQQDQSPVKVCQEMLLPGCDCCRIGPCKLCLTWTVGTKIYLGKASGDGQEWSGSAGDVSFRAYWDESYCTINVELDGELVWTRSLCEDYDAVTCRNWDDDTAFTTYAGDSGTFAWEVMEVLELLRRKGGEAYSESECADYFCGTCSCIPEELCVGIFQGLDVLGVPSSEETGALCDGPIPFTGTTCDDKVTEAEWSGVVACDTGSVTVTVILERGSYDECIASGTAIGTIGIRTVSLAMEPTVVSDCETMSVVWSVIDGDDVYDITVESKDCEDCDLGVSVPCCPDTTVPKTLYATLSGSGCSNIDGEVIVLQLDELLGDCWNGIRFNLPFPPDQECVMGLNLQCSGDLKWRLNTGSGCGGPDIVDADDDITCSPISLRFEMGNAGCCEGGIASNLIVTVTE